MNNFLILTIFKSNQEILPYAHKIEFRYTETMQQNTISVDTILNNHLEWRPPSTWLKLLLHDNINTLNHES